MKYYVIVQATAFPLSAEEFSVDSAFAGHLLQLREQLGSRFEELVLVGPAMSAESYKATRASHDGSGRADHRHQVLARVCC